MTVICIVALLATGFFMGATAVCSAGYRLEAQSNRKTEKDIAMMKTALDYAKHFGIDYETAYTQIKITTTPSSKK